MLLVCLLIFFLPFVASDDFDEITHRDFLAANISIYRTQEYIKIAKEGVETTNRTMFVQCNKTDYLRNFTFLENYGYLLTGQITKANLVRVRTSEDTFTATLYTEVRGNDFALLLQFRYVHQSEQCELYRVEDLACGLPKRRYIDEVIEMIEHLYFTEGEWEKKTLHWMFTHDSQFKFCDGSVERYFFHQNDTWSHARGGKLFLSSILCASALSSGECETTREISPRAFVCV